ncbi:ATP-dependent helicase HrpB [Schaalia sp. 19OD2882]|uniref:ATP-dependent helicase HrpB n=1 Tax=Schaalia sp. 19OD2882 TaxID=2794089 RepID=UPI0020A6E8DC|nr:ATP-dependent helicase HrpB [Schaalia sp. 19OD2882]
MTSDFDRLLARPPELPVVEGLPEVVRALVGADTLVVTAPPGSGKTSLLPALLAGHFDGRILVTQPRRVAVRAAARRLAGLLGEPLGESVGHTVRGESSCSGTTRVEFATPGVLVRRLLRDPDLHGVDAVMIDEFHERQLDTDLVLAMLLAGRQAGRTKAHLTVTSATLDTAMLLPHLRRHCDAEPALVDVPGRIHPLRTLWAPPPRGVGPLVTDRLGRTVVDRRFCAHVARTIARALDEGDGDVLVFLPGVWEIDEVARSLGNPEGVEVLVLHGNVSASTQDRILSPRNDGRRHVVLSTSVAESSLTVPGVRTVVDAGLAREPRFDPARGAGMLVTVPASRARGDQRAGRAARLGPGTVLRCWEEAESARRPARTRPEIETADVTEVVLQCATWRRLGLPEPALPTPVPDGAATAARQSLQAMWALEESGEVTDLGVSLAALPLEPGLARALLESAALVGAHEAAGLVAFLAEEPRVRDADLARLFTQVKHGSELELGGRMRAQAQRLERLVSADMVQDTWAGLGLAVEGDQWAKALRPGTSSEALALVVALAHPRWIARLRPGTSRYLMVDGQGAQLPPSSPLEGSTWLAVAELQRTPGVSDALIRSAAPINPVVAEYAATPMRQGRFEANLVQGRIRGRRVEALGAIELVSRHLDAVPEGTALDVLGKALQREGLGLLEWPRAAQELRWRMTALHEALGPPWPDVSDAALAARAAMWLAGDLPGLAAGAPLSRIDTLAALRAMLPWPEAARLDELAPERVEIPTGATRSLDWSSGRPILTLRVQEAFGWVDSPTFADGRVALVVHLTDPAGRPTAVTSDLRSFWSGPYQQVRSHLRGRYPKHPWPEDPFTEKPTSRAKPRPRT